MAVRQEKTRPLLNALEGWLREKQQTLLRQAPGACVCAEPVGRAEVLCRGRLGEGRQQYSGKCAAYGKSWAKKLSILRFRPR